MISLSRWVTENQEHLCHCGCNRSHQMLLFLKNSTYIIQTKNKLSKWDINSINTNETNANKIKDFLYFPKSPTISFEMPFSYHYFFTYSWSNICAVRAFQKSSNPLSLSFKGCPRTLREIKKKPESISDFFLHINIMMAKEMINKHVQKRCLPLPYTTIAFSIRVMHI